MKSEKPIKTLVSEYLEEQNINSLSRITYDAALKNWLTFCVTQRIDVRLPRKADVLHFKSNFLKNGLSINTINLNLAVLRKFFSWLELNGIYSNITEGVKNYRNDNRHLKKYLTEDQVKTLLESISTDTLKGMRDYCLIFLLVTTGLRRGEAARLKYSNIVWHDNRPEPPIIKIIRKGQDYHTAFGLSPEIKIALDNYFVLRNNDENISRYTSIFISLSPNSFGKKLTPSSISRIIKQRFRDIGIDDPMMTAHSLRHSAAIISLKHGIDLFSVSKMLGHTSIETTRIYLQAIEDEVAQNNPAVQELSKTFHITPKTAQKQLILDEGIN